MGSTVTTFYISATGKSGNDVTTFLSSITSGSTITVTLNPDIYSYTVTSNITGGGGTIISLGVTFIYGSTGNQTPAPSATVCLTASIIGPSGVTINNNVDNFVLTATGVIGTVQGEAALQFSNPTLSFTGTGSPTLGASQIYLNGGTSNRIDFNQTGAGAPTFTTRSAGTKIALYPNISATSVDIGLGYMADGGVPSMWYSILSPTSNGVFYWYAGTTQIMALVNLAAGTRRLDLTAGTVTNPAISAGLNSSDTNTGIYFPAADTIGFVEGGVEAMRIDANGRVNFLAGSAANPIINAGLNSSDTNTGIYFPAADTIGFVEGGVEAMRIDLNGRVNFLAGSAANPIINAGLNSSDTNTGIYFPAADTIGFVEGGVETMRIDSNSTVNFLAGTVSLPSINAGLSASDTNTGIYFPAADTIGFVEGGVEAMRIDSNGRINLLGGTIANPILNAGLNSTDTDTGLYFPAANSIGLVTSGIEIIRLSANTVSFSGGTVSLPVINAGLNSNDTNTGFYFPSGDTIGFATNATSRMLINDSGVGIGMTPTSRFQVNQSGIRIQVDATGTGINTAPSEWIHLLSDPANNKWIQIDATQFSASPTEQGGSPDTAIGQSGNKNKYLTEPDYWIEIKLGAAGGIVLIPCYVPA